MGALAAVDVS